MSTMSSYYGKRKRGYSRTAKYPSKIPRMSAALSVPRSNVNQGGNILRQYKEIKVVAGKTGMIQFALKASDFLAANDQTLLQNFKQHQLLYLVVEVVTCTKQDGTALTGAIVAAAVMDVQAPPGTASALVSGANNAVVLSAESLQFSTAKLLNMFKPVGTAERTLMPTANFLNFVFGNLAVACLKPGTGAAGTPDFSVTLKFTAKIKSELN